jgi:hypothetical protein
VLCEPTRRYDFSEFDEFREMAPTRRRRQKLQHVRLPRPRKSLPRTAEIKFNELVAACAAEERDRSKTDFRLCCFAIRKGIDPEIVWDAVKDISKFGDRGSEYFEITWANAQDEVREQILDRAQQKVDEEKLKGDDGAEPSPQTAQLETAFEALGPARVLADMVRECDYFAVDVGGKLYHYAAGCATAALAAMRAGANPIACRRIEMHRSSLRMSWSS